MCKEWFNDENATIPLKGDIIKYDWFAKPDNICLCYFVKFSRTNIEKQ